MSDLRVPQPASLALFADDAAIYIRNINRNRIVSNMNRLMPAIEKWYDQWRLKINTNKTQAIMISRGKKKNPETKFKLNGTEIKWNNTVKYLGVTVDKTLSFTEHIDNKIKTARAAKAKLTPLLSGRSKLANKNKASIFNAIFLPAILYACTVWAAANKSAIDKICRFQSGFLRSALRVPMFTRNSVLFQEIGAKTIRERIQDLAIRHYEGIDSNPSQLIKDSIKYPLKKIRRSRPRDILLYRPP